MREEKNPFPIYRTGIGQDSHRFVSSSVSKPCILGGVLFPESTGMEADSDGDVIFHAICNAISSLSCVPILGGIARDLCHRQGITNSQCYVERALETLGRQRILHVALTIEGKKPHFQKMIDAMRERIASVLKLHKEQVGICATSGDGLSDFGRGEGIQCFCILTTVEELIEAY